MFHEIMHLACFVYYYVSIAPTEFLNLGTDIWSRKVLCFSAL